MAEFLGKGYSEETLAKIAEHCSFYKMKNNPRCNMEDMPAYDMKISKFMRHGKPGDWKNYFTEEQNCQLNDRFNKRLAESSLAINSTKMLREIAGINGN